MSHQEARNLIPDVSWVIEVENSIQIMRNVILIEHLVN